jgi:hypothetical protein
MVFDQLTPEQVGQLAAISAAIEAGVEEVSSSPAAAACHAEADARGSQAAEPLEPIEGDGGSCPL